MIQPMQDVIGSLARSLAAATVALRNGAIRRGTLAFLAYNTVEMASWTAILVYAYSATGPASVGIVAVVQLVPSAVIAPLLASVGDRYPRAHVLLGWFVAQGVALAAIGIAILADAPPVAVYFLSLLSTVALTQTRPIYSSLLPELARTPSELTAANALSAIAVGLGGFVGPIITGLVLAYGNPAYTFLAAAAITLGGGALLVGIRGHAGAPGRPERDDGDAASALRPADLVAGLREVVRDADLAVVMALLTAQLVIFGGMEVFLVLLAIDLLGIGESGAGYLIGVLGLGAIVGGVASFALVGRRRLAPWLGIAAVVIGLPIALIGVAPAARTAALLLVVCGIGFAILEVAGQTLLQRITPDAVRARVFGILEGLMLIGEAVGSLIVPVIALAIGLEGTAIALGLLLPAVAAVAMLRFARIDARVTIPDAELHALRAVPMFPPLGAAALEGLARHLVRMPVTAGLTVIREGDAGDRWYLVDGGRFGITRGGAHLTVVGPGEDFGEIALLRNVPRTATVTALEDGVLWALDREQFIAAVAGSPQALFEAERIATVRLP
jgi:MFS family permease